MKALVCRGNGRPEVDLVEIPPPSAATSEALVGVGAVAINRGELRLLTARAKGWRPGQDVAGTVIASAADGTGPAEGSRVVAWPEQAGWAQVVAVPTTHLASLAPGVSLAAAATLPIAGVTALRLLRLLPDVSYRRVLVTGAAGGVGRFAVEIAAAAHARVTAVARPGTRAQGLTELGAESVVAFIEDLDGPFDLILESVGGPSLEAAVRLVAAGGTVVVYGNSSDLPAKLAFGDFRGRPGARIEAFFVYESGEPPTFGEDLQHLADLVATDRLHPEVGMEVPWSDANLALELLQNRQVKGKAVLIVD